MYRRTVFISCKNETHARRRAWKRSAIDIKFTGTAVSAFYKTLRSVCTLCTVLLAPFAGRREYGKLGVSYRVRSVRYTALARDTLLGFFYFIVI